MATTVTTTIGATGRNRATLALWEANDLPASLITADEQHIAEMYNDAEFTSVATIIRAATNTDATRNVIIRAAAGQSFTDHADKATNPLRYDATKGVGISAAHGFGDLLNFDCQFGEVEGIQLKGLGGSHAQSVFNAIENNHKVKNVIIENTAGNPCIDAVGGGKEYVNVLCIMDADADVSCVGGSGETKWIGCGFIQPTNHTTHTASKALDLNFTGLHTVTDCYFFGWDTLHSELNAATITGSFNASDDIEANCPGALGNNNKGSLTIANEIEQPSSAVGLDCRAKSGGSLDGGGTRHALTNDLDIVERSRSLTTPTIGPWEVIAAGGPVQASTALGGGASLSTAAAALRSAAAGLVAGAQMQAVATVQSAVMARLAAAATILPGAQAAMAAAAVAAGEAALALVPAGGVLAMVALPGESALAAQMTAAGARVGLVGSAEVRTFGAIKSAATLKILAGSGLSADARIAARAAEVLASDSSLSPAARTTLAAAAVFPGVADIQFDTTIGASAAAALIAEAFFNGQVTVIIPSSLGKAAVVYVVPRDRWLFTVPADDWLFKA